MIKAGGISHNEGFELSSKGHTTNPVAWAAKAAKSTRTRTHLLDSSLFLFLERRPAKGKSMVMQV